MVWKYLFGSDEEKVQAPAATPVEEVKPQKSSGGFWSTDKGEVKGVSTGEAFTPAEVAPLVVKDLEPETTGRVLPINAEAPAAEEGELITPPEVVEATAGDVVPTPAASNEIDIRDSNINAPAAPESEDGPAAPTAEEHEQEGAVVLKLENNETTPPTDAPAPDLHLETHEEPTEPEAARPVFSVEEGSMPIVGATEEAPKSESHEGSEQEQTVFVAAEHLVEKNAEMLKVAQDYLKKVEEVHQHTIENNEKRQAALAEITGRHNQEKTDLEQRHNNERHDLESRHSRELADITSAAQTAAQRVENLASAHQVALGQVDSLTKQAEYFKQLDSKAEEITDKIEHGSEMAA